jgi:NADPH:quinone reductase-like Zn-dependent oxidoreductase
MRLLLLIPVSHLHLAFLKGGGQVRFLILIMADRTLIFIGSESYRVSGPCVDEHKWTELLLESGFSGIDLLFAEFEGPNSHECGMLVSTAVEDLPASLRVAEIEIVYNSAESAQIELARLLVKDLEPFVKAPIRCSSVQEAVNNKAEDSLLRVVLVELERPVLTDIEPELFEQLQTLFASTTELLWINNGGGIFPSQPQSRLAEGMFRVLKTERDQTFHLLSLEPQTSLTRTQHDHIINVVTFLLSSAGANADMEYIEHEGVLNVPRLLPSKALNENISLMASSHQYKVQNFDCGIPLQLNAASPGLLNGFEFIEDESATLTLKPDEIEIQVKCAGINFRDVLTAVGQLKAGHTGSELSGSVSRVGNACSKFQVGDFVVGLHNGCFSTSIRMRESDPVVKIPAGMSFSDAAAVPINFATSYIALHNVARIQSGETVLIHSASGGTGQAAVQIAKNAGATIFATVGSESKKKLLVETYNIPESHIFSSRTTLFSKMIKHRTGGKGVDVILNSLAGESLFASWKCIAPYGRFLEIGKRDILSNQRLPMLKFLENATFSGVDLAAISVERPWLCTAALQSVFALIQEGKVHPSQPINVYGIGEMEKAFRIMQTGQHIGKMVLEMRGDDQVKVCFSFLASASQSLMDSRLY